MKIRRYLDVCIHNDSFYREIIRMLLIKCEEEVIAFRTSFRGLLRRCPLQHLGEDCDGEFGRLRQGLTCQRYNCGGGIVEIGGRSGCVFAGCSSESQGEHDGRTLTRSAA